MKKCLVTGGAGFIGSHIVDALLKRGCSVTVLDNLSTGKTENMAGFSDQIDFVEGSVTDIDTVHACCAGVDVIFHESCSSPTRRVGEQGR